MGLDLAKAVPKLGILVNSTDAVPVLGLKDFPQMGGNFHNSPLNHFRALPYGTHNSFLAKKTLLYEYAHMIDANGFAALYINLQAARFFFRSGRPLTSHFFL